MSVSENADFRVEAIRVLLQSSRVGDGERFGRLGHKLEGRVSTNL